MKKADSNNSLINYGLENISTHKFTFNNPQLEFDISSFQINYKITPEIRSNVLTDRLFISLTIEAIIKETEEKISEIMTVFTYQIKNFKDFVTIEPNTENWDFIDKKHIGLIVTLIGTSISTTRGILLEKTNGTILQNKPMPIINPSVFLEKDKNGVPVSGRIKFDKL